MEASTKKTILVWILSLCGILLLAALGWFIYFKMQFSVYEDDQFKFTIKYPTAWKEVIHPKPQVAAVFLRPKDTALDVLQENFNVTIQPVPMDMVNIGQFSKTVTNQMTAVFGKSIKVVTDKDVKIGWREGHELIIEAPTPDHLILVTGWVLRENMAYIMTFLGDMNKYDGDRFYVHEMIHSLDLQ